LPQTFWQNSTPDPFERQKSEIKNIFKVKHKTKPFWNFWDCIDKLWLSP